MDIILADLDHFLFPERYPFARKNTEAFKAYNEKSDNTSIGRQNVRFMIRMIKHSLSIENEELRCLCYKLYETLVDNHFDWRKPYEWKDLKVLLMTLKLFSSARNCREVKEIYAKEATVFALRKYMLKEIV
ncbi:MAG: hypothetical protein ACOYOA_11515 [Saprospiraceae bacterium]